MRAHFAGDVEDGTVVAAASTATPGGSGGSEVARSSDTTGETNAAGAADSDVSSLEARIDDFKRDSQNMEELSEFIDDVLQSAESEALKQQTLKNGKKSQQTKEKSRQSFSIPDFKNGKVVNRARGLVVRIFDAIGKACVGATAPAQRMKLRGKRASTPAAQNGTAESESSGDKQEAKDKPNKKHDTAKEKKDEKKKEKLDKQHPPEEESAAEIQPEAMELVQSA